MKSFLSVVFIAAIALTLAGCGSEKVKGPPAKVIGQWEWSNPAGASWHLTISPDGKFRREMIDSAKAKPTEIHGSWTTFEPRQKEQSWLKRHRLFQKNPEDELTRKAGYDPAKNKIEWSAPTLLSLHYSTSAPAPKAPGTAPEDSKATPTQDIVIGETEAVRTYTDLDTGDVFLELAGKTYKKVEGAASAPPEVATPAPEATPKPTPVPSTPSSSGPAASATPAPATPAPPISATPVPLHATPPPVTPIRATRGSIP
ncbi:MAG TPA: hypothetical protein VGM54_07425 [Chthoniobacter sp.]|jgi:hypothetical protein